jgi:serine/threonine protein phosphatase 1
MNRLEKYLDDGWFEAFLRMRLYVIGDIHGRADLLDQIVRKIRDDMDDHEAVDCLTITLGDYVDRGPDSRGVLDRLSRNPFPTPYIGVRGNHEQLFERFMDDPSIAHQWRRLGGLETLRSYGIPIQDVMVGRGYDEAAHALRAAVPPEQLHFLTSLQPFVTVDQYYFCHAGIRPDVPLASQKMHDLMWIRDEFLKSEAQFEKVIVHGHTPCEWPEVCSNRINIDTGAFATGRLTCLVLDGTQGRFLFTSE